MWTGRSNAAADFVVKGFALEITGGSTKSIVTHSARQSVDAVVTYKSIPNYMGYEFARWLVGG